MKRKSIITLTAEEVCTAILDYLHKKYNGMTISTDEVVRLMAVRDTALSENGEGQMIIKPSEEGGTERIVLVLEEDYDER